MVSISTRYKRSVLLAAAAIALAACGGSSENSNTASTVALGVKNAALVTTSTSTTTTTISATTTTCAVGGACVVGDTGPGGGTVFYVAPTRFTSKGSVCDAACKYLEAAPVGWITAATPAGQTNCETPGTSTTDPQCVWSGNTTTIIGTTGSEIGSGYANTSAMIAQSNVAGRAATVARAFQGGGKTDWFLPSRYELNQMYLQRSAIGGYASADYWSSSEEDAGFARLQVFYDGSGSNFFKTAALYVRPVRAFSGSAAVAATTTTVATTTTTVAWATTTCRSWGACVVGDTGPGGGKVFYVAPTSFTSTGSACGTKCRYLEAAPVGWLTAATPAGQTNCVVAGTSTTDPQCAWSGNTSAAIGSTGTGIGSGYANTSAMIAQSNVAGRAATVARAFQGRGKTDWFLPSKDELNLLYLQRSAIGGFASGYYWSSSEYAAYRAWYQYLDYGYQNNFFKTNAYYVRPVRAF